MIKRDKKGGRQTMTKGYWGKWLLRLYSISVLIVWMYFKRENESKLKSENLVCKLFSGVAGTHDGEEGRRHQVKVSSSWSEWCMGYLPVDTIMADMSPPAPLLLLLNSLTSFSSFSWSPLPPQKTPTWPHSMPSSLWKACSSELTRSTCLIVHG